MKKSSEQKLKKLIDAANNVCSHVDPDELQGYWPELAKAVRKLAKALDAIDPLKGKS